VSGFERGQRVIVQPDKNLEVVRAEGVEIRLPAFGTIAQEDPWGYAIVLVDGLTEPKSFPAWRCTPRNVIDEIGMLDK